MAPPTANDAEALQLCGKTTHRKELRQNCAVDHLNIRSKIFKKTFRQLPRITRICQKMNGQTAASLHYALMQPAYNSHTHLHSTVLLPACKRQSTQYASQNVSTRICSSETKPRRHHRVRGTSHTSRKTKLQIYNLNHTRVLRHRGT
jgi:hypothetical protein